MNKHKYKETGAISARLAVLLLIVIVLLILVWANTSIGTPVPNQNAVLQTSKPAEQEIQQQEQAIIRAALFRVKVPLRT